MTTERRDDRFDCETASGLLPGYLDGELTEAQAAPLREHLLACVRCRGMAVDQKNLTRWFVDEPVEVPDGFAARVARRAFAGDPGTVSTSHTPGPIARVVTAEREVPAERDVEILPFVLRLTAAAAVLLFGLSLFLRGSALSFDQELMANDYMPPWERERVEAQRIETQRLEAERLEALRLAEERANTMPVRADLPAESGLEKRGGSGAAERSGSDE